MARGFSSGWKIATIFGLTIRIHPSWLLIFFLLWFSLATYILPMSDISGTGYWWEGHARIQEYHKNHPDASDTQVLEALMTWPQWHYWVLAFVGTIGLFVCVLAHEMSHSLVARAGGIPVEGITLFIFGGVSSLKEEANDPNTELKVALAGPLVSLLIGGGCFAAFFLVPGLSAQAAALVLYFAVINTLLAAFNMLPGFPLDGGRVLRAILWKMSGSLRDATAKAARAGRGLGTGMIVVGVGLAIVQWTFGPLWLAFIGLFLRYAAQSAYQQMAIREALQGLKVQDVLKEEVVTVEPDLTIADLVDNYFYKHRFRSFPVLTDGEFVGMISLKDVQGVPRAQWDNTPVRDVMHQVAEENRVHRDDDLISVFRKMMSEEKGHLPVVDGDRLSGIVTRHDIMSLLQIRTDLGEDLPGPLEARPRDQQVQG